VSTEHLKQAVILAAFIERVRELGYLCGETLVQKAAYVMKELFEVPLEDEFRIHYYGPFSFQLRDRLAAMEADDIVRVTPREMGVTYETGSRFEQLRKRFPRTIAANQLAIDFAARELGALGVKKLEPITTALFVTRQHPDMPAKKRIALLREIKPHVTAGEASTAIARIDGWITTTSA